MQKNKDKNTLNSGDLKMTNNDFLRIIEKNQDDIKQEMLNIHSRLDDVIKSINNQNVCMIKNCFDTQEKFKKVQEEKFIEQDKKFATWKVFMWTAGVLLGAVGGLYGIIINLHIGT